MDDTLLGGLPGRSLTTPILGAPRRLTRLLCGVFRVQKRLNSQTIFLVSLKKYQFRS